MLNDHTRAKGGKREGSGRKPKKITKFRQLSLTQKGKEAEKSLNLLIEFRDDENEPKDFRRDCANDIIDRIWGKPKQAHEHSGKDGGDIIVRIERQGTGEPWRGK